MNPVRVLVQRVITDLDIDATAFDEPAPDHFGTIQTFETRISLACADRADQHESFFDEDSLTGCSLVEALAKLAGIHYGRAGYEAALEIACVLEDARPLTVGERGVW